MNRFGPVMVLVVGVACVAGDALAQVTVTTDRTSPIGTSLLKLGITHTQSGIDHADAKPQAVARATPILTGSASYQNSHIIGWGPGNINPEPGVYQWGTLDARVEMMRQLDIPMVLTLCTAPGWMKVGGDTWNMEERVRADRYDQFADLCLQVAKRYPDVKTFQVWNELKGFWSLADNNWDVVEYTRMYNKVYDKLKAYDPTIKVGGLYLVVSGTGSNLTRDTGGVGRDFFTPLGNKDRQVIQYWLDNAHGADFICIDRGIKDGQDETPYTRDELMRFTTQHGNIVRQVREMTDLPVWYSEYYGTVDTYPQPIAAAYASIYKGIVEAGASAALLWNPNADGATNPHELFTDVRNENGGKLTPHGKVYEWIAEYFEAGTPLFETLSSSDTVEALASDTHTLLINKADYTRNVWLNGELLSLLRFEVRLLDAEGRFIASTQLVPEPASLMVLGAGMALVRRRPVNRNT